MATRNRTSDSIISDNDLDQVVERCEDCGRETDHVVGIRIMDTARRETAESKYSREPCRVCECRVCGKQTITLMNHV